MDRRSEVLSNLFRRQLGLPTQHEQRRGLLRALGQHTDLSGSHTHVLLGDHDIDHSAMLGDHAVGAIKAGLDNLPPCCTEEGGCIPEEMWQVFANAHHAHKKNAYMPPQKIFEVCLPKRQDVMEWANNTANPYTHPSSPPSKNKHYFLDGPTYSCTKDVGELEPLLLRQLSIPKKHEGKVIFVRVLTKTMVDSGTTFHVEDSEGFALPLTIPFPTPTFYSDSREVLQGLYPAGTILAIKEPYLKFGLDGYYALRVEVPSDIVSIHHLSEEAKKIKWKFPSNGAVEMSWVDNRASGDEMSQEGNYLIARRHYTSALADPTLAKDSIECFSVLLSLVDCNLQLRCYGAAYRNCVIAQALLDAKHPWSSDVAEHDKANLRLWKAEAAYELQLFKHANSLIDLCEDTIVYRDTVKRLRRSLVTRHEEASDGHYDLHAHRLAVLDDPTPRSDVADFVGPIKVTYNPKRGRGIVTTEDVVVGDLIMVSKAIAEGYPAAANGVSVHGFQFDNTFHIRAGAAHLICQAIHRLVDDPSMSKAWSGLLSSGEQAGSTIDRPSPVVTEEQRLKDIWHPARIDVNEKIFPAYDVNAFTGNIQSSAPLTDSDMDNTSKAAEFPLFLFGLPSLINHSCLPNVSQVFLGEVAYIRPVVDLPEGTELTISYVFIEKSYYERMEQLDDWAIGCSCQLCVLDRKDDHFERQELMEKTHARLEKTSKALVKTGYESPAAKKESRQTLVALYKLEDEVEKTYAKGRPRSTKIELGTVWKTIAILAAHVDLEESIKAEVASLECYGLVPATQAQRNTHGRSIQAFTYAPPGGGAVIVSLLKISKMYYELNNTDEGRAWARTAFWAHEILVGGGMPRFAQRYAGYLPKWDEKDLAWNEVTEDLWAGGKKPKGWSKTYGWTLE
ncbi:hypothetical protein CI109_102170 [Kwoniella shandongensis]|uniref:Uncharacterized protein n=1 Tax=Kwoniella shandongensis TaxID=1734106 RepID=A0A5M6BYW4_9TREE|nr:uncharacterized protein CI109_003671 [Kwoniella shandongensis]KAA5528016.1 hypothetical protein CI109_003671 [Kwoniella shandongensis]